MPHLMLATSSTCPHNKTSQPRYLVPRLTQTYQQTFIAFAEKSAALFKLGSAQDGLETRTWVMVGHEVRLAWGSSPGDPVPQLWLDIFLMCTNWWIHGWMDGLVMHTRIAVYMKLRKLTYSRSRQVVWTSRRLVLTSKSLGTLDGTWPGWVRKLLPVEITTHR